MGTASRRRVLVAACAGALAASIAAGIAAAGSLGGPLVQLAMPNGCWSEDGSGGDCVDGTALEQGYDVAIGGEFVGRKDRYGKHLYVAAAGSNAVAAFVRDPDTGELTQLAGTAGCVSEDGSGGDCADGKALDQASGVAISQDSKHVYVASPGASAVAAFARDSHTSELTQLAGVAGCVSDNGSGGECTDGTALDDAYTVEVSPDGKHVYVGSAQSIAVFARNKTTGVLTQLAGTAGCVSDNGSGGACVDGTALQTPSRIEITQDGKNVYVASSGSDAIAAFARNKKTGVLTQLAGTAGCVSETGSGGACIDGKGLNGASGVVVSRNGKNLYVASGDGDAVAVFARNKSTGVLTQLAGTAGCVSESGSGGQCADGKALQGAVRVEVTQVGDHVYVTSQGSDAVATFSRDRTTGELTQLAGVDGCVSDNGTGGECADGTELNGAWGLVVTQDGRNVYATASISDALAVIERS